ncbi:MAG TPA: hypothetical protein PKD72_15405 [Gemmatales bacterium]|mgnify:CR=1 FL=1|nr:hypothetical protein [Gemmatales bacterium]
MPKTSSTYWQLPWNKLLQQIPWQGTELFTPAPAREEPEPEPEPEPVYISSVPVPVDLPAKPMTMSFSKLLAQIPWQGTSMTLPQNRLKGVMS